jgi:hypothetical protein
MLQIGKKVQKEKVGVFTVDFVLKREKRAKNKKCSLLSSLSSSSSSSNSTE